MNDEEQVAHSQAFFKYDSALMIIRALRQKGHVALLAGGCVRDILLKRRPKDYDVVTSARPDQVKALFERTVDVGEKFGVIKVLIASLEFEVATFRSDEDYRDGRHPQGVRFARDREDAMRRDFTVNGMFYDPVEGKVVDHVGGRLDLDRRLIRAIGDPNKRFGEDYLRMLRAIRFAETLQFTIESETFQAVRLNAEKITSISGERIREELEGILVDQNRRMGLEMLDDGGLLVHILPEVAACKGVRQGKLLHPEGDVWQHTLLAVSMLEEPSFEFTMAVLLHDIGKPPTADSGRERLFLDHERVGEQMSRRIAERLKLSKRETDTIAFLVRHHMILKDVARMKKSTMKRLFAHEFFEQLAELHRIDAMASNRDLSNYDFAVNARSSLSEEAIKPKPFLNGEDLAALGVERGPRMGRILRLVYNAQLDEEIASREEALALAGKLAAEPPTE